MRLRWCVLLVCLVGAAAGMADELDPARREPRGVAVDERRVIVKLRANGAGTRRKAASAATLATRAGVTPRRARRIGGGFEVMSFDPDDAPDVQALLERLRADPDVELAELDERRYLHALPDDPLYVGQWYLQSRADAPAAIDAEGAWEITAGSTGAVIAVIDTGVLFDHPDLVHAGLGGRLLPGYDFVSSSAAANDGDGRDPDASDPGDWVSVADLGTPAFAGCDLASSSWHGTRVAGLIGARANNADGIAGATWSTWILPVRVIGKCGGFDSDILAGMLWAGGVSVDGVPDNPYPARVINMSLGSLSRCPGSYAAVVAELAARGVLVVASAGNEGGPVAAPANCPGVVAVAGLRHAGTKVGYSSLGPEVTIAAPAGNCAQLSGACLYSLDTTTNLGVTTPGAHGYTDQLNANVGTSFSAPVVAGIAGLMLAANGNLRPAQIAARLAESALPFPVSEDPAVPFCHVPLHPGDIQGTECNCTTDTCGAGMASARRAVEAALRPIAAVRVLGSIAPGQNVELSAAGSAAACGRTIASYAWEIVEPGTGFGIGGTDPAVAVVVAPATGSYTVRLTVTDDAGREDVADVVLTATSASTSAPEEAGTQQCLSEIDPPPPPPVVVSVSPGTASVQVGGSVQFTATLMHASTGGVVWHVDGVAGGNAELGTISADGLYVAPAAVPAPATVTITAAWTEDAARFGAAEVTVTAPPPAGDSGGGGGGAMDLGSLLAVLLGALWIGRRGGAAERASARANERSHRILELFARPERITSERFTRAALRASPTRR